MKHLRSILSRLLPTIILGLLLGACNFHPSPPELATSPTGYIEAGTATPHEVWRVKSALHKAGIPNYADGKDYAQPYRILVAPTNKQRAAEIIGRFN